MTEYVEKYSDKEYFIDFESTREDTFEDAAPSSDEEVPDPGNIEAVEEEFQISTIKFLGTLEMAY